jgi:hypothetical protein
VLICLTEAAATGPDNSAGEVEVGGGGSDLTYEMEDVDRGGLFFYLAIIVCVPLSFCLWGTLACLASSGRFSARSIAVITMLTCWLIAVPLFVALPIYALPNRHWASLSYEDVKVPPTLPS